MSADHPFDARPSAGAGEFAEVDVDEPLQQGDVIELTDKAADFWGSHYGVILTANCDLAFDKHGGILSYLPIVPLSKYVETVVLPRLVEARLQSAFKSLARALPADEGWPTSLRVAELLELHGNLSAAIDSLPDEPARDRVLNTLRRIERIGTCSSVLKASTDFDLSLRSADTLLNELRVLDGSPALPDGKALAIELRNRLTSGLPGDSFFLDRIGSSAGSGYVVYLRLIREVSARGIARSAIEERSLKPALAGRRISRLDLLFTHKLVQQAMQVFSDIGLPDEYDTAWTSTVDSHLGVWFDSEGN